MSINFSTNSVDGPDAGKLYVNGQSLLNFSGFCYLALGGHPEVIEAASSAAHQYGLCNDLGYGLACPVFGSVERLAAKFAGYEDCLYFATGYLMYPMALEAIRENVDCVFTSSSTHYSAKLAADAAKLRHVVYPSDLSLEKLAALIASNLKRGERPAILADGVAPTDGSSAPITNYLTIVGNHDGYVIVDDAHGFGTVGPDGKGSGSDHLSNDRLIRGATLSKAFSVQGGIIFGNGGFINSIRSGSKIYNGTTLPAAPVAAAAAKALEIAIREPWRVQQLKANARILKDGLKNLGLPVISPTSESPIAAFSLGDSSSNQKLKEHLRDSGIVAIVSHYIGAPPEGCIRLSVYADHRAEDIDYLLTAVSTGLAN